MRLPPTDTQLLRYTFILSPTRSYSTLAQALSSVNQALPFATMSTAPTGVSCRRGCNKYVEIASQCSGLPEAASKADLRLTIQNTAVGP